MIAQANFTSRPKLYTGDKSYVHFAKNVQAQRIVFLTFPQISPALKTRLSDAFAGKEVIFIPYPFGYPDIEDIVQFHQALWEKTLTTQTLLIGVGGGSVLDFAKIMRFKPTYQQWLKKQLDKVFLEKNTEKTALALIPTTSGTGSEVTPTATVWNKAEGVKHSFFGEAVYADYAIVSGEFSLGLSWLTSRDTALDALSHALEAIWNVNRTHESNEYAIIAARVITQNLPKLKNDLDNITLRNHLACGSLLAGLAMAKTQTALAHALSYEDTLKNQTAHGLAVAYWLPYVWQMLCLSDDKEGQKYVKLALSKIGTTPQALEDWLTQLEVPVMPHDAISSAVTSRIAMMMASPRGKNFSPSQPISLEPISLEVSENDELKHA